MTLRTIPLARARRIALAAQGFSDPHPTGAADVRHLRRALKRVGLLQIDSVNVICRAHYMPMLARIGAYPTERLDEMNGQVSRTGTVRAGAELFEYWGHAASMIPVSGSAALPVEDERDAPVAADARALGRAAWIRRTSARGDRRTRAVDDVGADRSR